MKEIRNTHEQLVEAVRQGIITQEQAVSISWLPMVSRQPGGMVWQVYSPYFKTDPDAAWYNYQKKSFLADPHNRMDVLPKVTAWCESMYGITEWARNTTGEYVPRVVNKAVPIPRRKKKK